MSSSDKWTNGEKELLFTALQEFGPDDLDSLHAAVPCKSRDSIEKLLLHYKILAEHSICNDTLLNFDFISRKTKNNSREPTGVPLSEWVNVLKECSYAESTNTVLSDCLRLIAFLEDLPKPNEDFKFDLKQLYLFLACIASGETPPELSEGSQEFLVHSLLMLSAKAKAQRLPEYIDFIHEVSRIFQERRHVHANDKPDDPNSQAFHHIVSSSSFNPLELPPHFLNRNVDTDK